MKTAGIILAAGRGSRMANLTSGNPKCLVKLAGRPLLEWQLVALGALDEILIVTGYRGEMLRDFGQTVENPAWESTNMLASLLCAVPFASDFFASGGDRLIVSYSDIVYPEEHVEKLLGAKEDIAIAYDMLWNDLWSLRFKDPLADAETFRQQNGLLLEIGGKTGDMAAIQGQYMGLLSFNGQGWQTLLSVCQELGDKVAKTDMTAFLRQLLARNIPIGAVPVAGKWCEADSGEDINTYEAALAKGSWSHDWRHE